MVSEEEKIDDRLIVAMGVGVLIGAFGVIAWALSAVNKDRGEKDDRDN